MMLLPCPPRPLRTLPRPAAPAARGQTRQRALALVLAAVLAVGAAPLPAALGFGPGPALAAASEAAPDSAQADPGDDGGRGRDHGAGKDRTDRGQNGKGHGAEDMGDDAATGDDTGGWDVDPDGDWDGSVSDGYVTVDDDSAVDDGTNLEPGSGPTEVDPDLVADPGVVEPVSPRDGTGGVTIGDSGPTMTGMPSDTSNAPAGRMGTSRPIPSAPPPATAAPPQALPPASAGAVRAARGEGQVRASLVLVELFTSQGCSACPPAESLLGELARQPGVLALSLHVDYWDYLGWKDSFAQPRFTSRQRAYARRDGARSVFTPQLVIGGVAGASAPRPAQVAREINRQQAAQAVTARLAAVNGRQRVTLSAPGGFARPADIIVVRALPQVDVEIRGGENLGRHVSHVNVVRDWDVVAEWDGKAPIVLDIATAAARGRGELVAVIVQERLAGPGGGALPGAALGAIKLD